MTFLCPANLSINLYNDRIINEMKNQISEPPGAKPALQPNVNSTRRSSVLPLPKVLNETIPALPEDISPARIYRSVDEMVHDMRPEMPVQCLRPATIAATAKRFLKAFPGDVMYAVKTNPDPPRAALSVAGRRYTLRCCIAG